MYQFCFNFLHEAFPFLHKASPLGHINTKLIETGTSPCDNEEIIDTN